MHYVGPAADIQKKKKKRRNAQLKKKKKREREEKNKTKKGRKKLQTKHERGWKIDYESQFRVLGQTDPVWQKETESRQQKGISSVSFFFTFLFLDF